VPFPGEAPEGRKGREARVILPAGFIGAERGRTVRIIRTSMFLSLLFVFALACAPRPGEGIDPKDAAVERGLRFLGEGKPSFAMGAFREALDLDPDDARAHYGLGRVFVETGYLEGAEREFRRAAATRSGYAEAHVGLASLAFRSGRFDEAERELREAKRLGAGGSAQALHLDGRLAERRGSLDEAEARYREALTASPEDAEVRLSLVDLLLASGRYAEALQELERRRFPRGREDDVRLRLADSHLHLGQDLEAERLYRQVAAARPLERRAAEGLVLLALRRSDPRDARRELGRLAGLLSPEDGSSLLEVAAALDSQDPFFAFLSSCRGARAGAPADLQDLLDQWIRELEKTPL
jgi:Tfp pilus assembly protein PilF